MFENCKAGNGLLCNPGECAKASNYKAKGLYLRQIKSDSLP